ncbi:MAG: GNAT family N-acetyltransferase [Deltaproteobacteria bacterium]|nr:GNAT family N-acetyltransferase [Deltaproteobacteria bacterium]
MSFHIRPATAADLPVLGRLGARLVKAHHGFDQQRFMKPGDDIEQGYAWFLGTQLQVPTVVVLVATAAEERVVGYVYAGIEPQSWKELRDEAGFIHDVVVDDAFDGQGLGSRLVEAAAQWLEDQGAPRVMLWTAENNRSAQQLFLRLGFRRTMIEMTREKRRS